MNILYTKLSTLTYVYSIDNFQENLLFLNSNEYTKFVQFDISHVQKNKIKKTKTTLPL